jgi:hypothetical protein
MIFKALAGLAGLGVLASCASNDVPREKPLAPLNALAPAPTAPLAAPPVPDENSQAN